MDIQDFVKNYQRARVSMTDAGIFGCRCDIDDVSPGDCCFCQLIVLDDMADSIESSEEEDYIYDDLDPEYLPLVLNIAILIIICIILIIVIVGGFIALTLPPYYGVK